MNYAFWVYSNEEPGRNAVLARVVPDIRPFIYTVSGRISGFICRISGGTVEQIKQTSNKQTFFRTFSKCKKIRVKQRPEMLVGLLKKISIFLKKQFLYLMFSRASDYLAGFAKLMAGYPAKSVSGTTIVLANSYLVLRLAIMRICRVLFTNSSNFKSPLIK